MNRRQVGIWLFLTFATAGSRLAEAFPPQYANDLFRAKYTVYSGDINGDGVVDLLFVPKRVVVLINYDVPFPVIAKPASPPFELLSGGGSYSVVLNPAASVVKNAIWKGGMYSLSYGDTLGTGSATMLVDPTTSGLPSFMFTTSATNGAPQLLEALTTSTIGVDLSAAGTGATLQDTNNDGRADLVVWVNGKLSTVLIAASDGTFSVPAAAAGGPSMTAWRSFVAAITLGDSSSASTFLSGSALSNYGPALAALGSTTLMPTIAKNWSEPQIVTLNADLMEMVVFQTEGGQVKMHLVDVVNDAGQWVVESF